MYDVIIIGAGASGLVCAIVGARRGKRILLLEKNEKVGKKLLATGNGKCNITNQNPISDRFHSQNRDFIAKALEGYSYKTIRDFFRTMGLELIEAKEGKVFPMSLQASCVVELLEYECKSLGVDIVCNSRVEDIRYKNNKYIVKAKDKTFESKKAVIATGHQSSPQLGGVRDGIDLAKLFGHKIINSYPSLVQLTSPMPKLKYIAGVKIEAKVRFRDINRVGDILFTKYGISGLAILDISRFVVLELERKKSVILYLDLMPKISAKQLLALFKRSLKETSIRPINIWLEGFINKKLINHIIEPLKLKDKLTSNLSEKSLKELIKQIKSFEFVINGSRGFTGAEVATGGVDTREINPKTMQSKKQKGLYLTGELLDIDGDRGGFNLHFAWLSGIRVGLDI